MQFVHGCGVGHEARVVVVHAVYVGPYLNFIGVRHGADQRSRVVASAALEVVDTAMAVAAYVSLGQIHVAPRVVGQQAPQAGAYVGHVGFAVVEGAHIVQCRQHAHGDSPAAHAFLHQGSAHQLALCENLFLGAFSEGFAEERPDEAERRLQACESRAVAAEQLVDHGAVFGFQCVECFLRSGYIALVEIFRNLHKRIGCARHCRKHHYVATLTRGQRRHGGDAPGTSHGSASEFQNLHLYQAMQTVFRGCC